MSRVHGVSIAWLHKLSKTYGILAIYQYNGGQLAGIATKMFKDKSSWDAVRSIVGILPPLLPSGGNALGGRRCGGNVSLHKMIGLSRTISTKPPPHIAACAIRPIIGLKNSIVQPSLDLSQFSRSLRFF